MRKFALVTLALLVLLAVVPKAYAEEGDVDLSQFPDKLAEALNIPLFAAQILTCSLILGLFLFPALLLTRNPMAHLLVGMLVLGFTIALGWLPVWIFAVLCMIIAVMFGSKFAGLIHGEGGGS